MENEKVFAMSFSKVYGLEAVFTDDNKTGRGRGTKETGGRKKMRKWISRILFVVSIILLSISLYFLMGMYLEDRKSETGFDSIR